MHCVWNNTGGRCICAKCEIGNIVDDWYACAPPTVHVVVSREAGSQRDGIGVPPNVERPISLFSEINDGKEAIRDTSLMGIWRKQLVSTAWVILKQASLSPMHKSIHWFGWEHFGFVINSCMRNDLSSSSTMHDMGCRLTWQYCPFWRGMWEVQDARTIRPMNDD